MLHSRSLPIVLALLLLSGVGVAQSAANRTCGFSVRLPAGWRMTPTANHSVKCWYSLENRKKDSCSVLVRTLDSDFPLAAKEAGFEQSGNQWVINQPWGDTIESEPLTGTGWKGIKANYVSRVTDASTGEVTGLEMLVAVLIAGTARSAIVTSDCRPEQFDAVVQSFQFIARR